MDGNCVLRVAPKCSRDQTSGAEAITLKIYATPLSANGRKVLAVSRHLGLKPEIHDVNVYRGEGRSPKYLAINPSGKILHAPDWSAALVHPVLHTLEAGLSANAFLAGPEPTIADFAVAGMTTYFRAAAFPSQRFPKIADRMARIESFDSWRGTLSPLWAQ